MPGADEKSSTPRVTRAQLRALGIAWPREDAIEDALVEDGGRIDVDATIARLEGNVDYAKRQLAEMHRFAAEWRAPVDDTTDRREDMEAMRAEGTRAIRALLPVQAVLRKVTTLPVVDELPGEAHAALEHELLRAVLDDPDAIAPRLAYALGQDAERAEFIRCQCEMEGLPTWHPRHHVRYLRALWLDYQNHRAWVRPVKDLCEAAQFRRGFVESVTVYGSQFAKHAEALFARAPVRRLNVDTGMDEIAGHPLFRRIREVSWKRPGHQLELLCRSEHASSLRELSIDEDELRDGVNAFAAAASNGSLGSLERLALWQVRNLASTLAALAGGETLPALSDLKLFWSYVGADPLATFVAGPAAARLRRLDLGIRTPEEADALASGAFPALTELAVDGDLGHAPLAPLCRTRAPRLRALKLTSLRLDEPAVEALAAMPLPELRDLEIYSPDFDAACGRALASAPWLGGLERLCLKGSKIYASSLAPIFASLGPGLLCLDTPLGHGAGHAFARSPAASSVVTLTIEGAIPMRDLDAALGGATSLAAVEVREPSKLEGDDRLRAAGLHRAANAEMYWYSRERTA